MRSRFSDAFVLIQKFHYKSANMPRIEAAIRVYAALLRQQSIRRTVMKKMLAMLLHTYPKVTITALNILDRDGN